MNLTKYSAFLIMLLSVNLTLTAQERHAEKKLNIQPISEYLLYHPKDYDEKSYESWPLILFLHGSGERGDSLRLVSKNGLPKLISEGKHYPFVVASPQCPTGRFWSADDLNLLLDELIKNNKIDPERIYLTGVSMGGFGTWDLATKYPERFAAIAPVCGGGNPDVACQLKDVPTWVFHGAKDNAVFPYQSRRMVEALNECGGNVRYTEYPEANHDSWTATYANPELYEWFLEHKKENKYSNDFAAFDKDDSIAKMRDDVILFTGSSSIRMWKNLRTDLNNNNVLNRGFGGSTYEELYHNIERLIFRYNPKKVFIYSGDNDIASGKSAEETFTDFEMVFDAIKDRLPETEIYIITPKPSPSRETLLPEMQKFNAYVNNYLQRQEKGYFVDTYNPMLDKDGQPMEKLFIEDMLHMNEKGYKIWAEVIKPYLE